jgi:DNA-binding MarR family transcriptional regulator
MAETRAIDRPGNKEALALWYTVNLQTVRDDFPDLSPRQTSILLTIYIDPKPYTIMMLSTRLKISKPAICRAIDMLEKLNLVQRKPDPKDRRKVFIARTSAGYKYLGKLSDTILNNLAAIA